MRLQFILYWTICLCVVYTGATAQDSIPSFSYKITDVREAVLVYRDHDGQPDLHAAKRWDKNLWFYLVTGKTATINDVNYVQIIIGDGSRVHAAQPWDPAAIPAVDPSDWNQPLWITKDNFDKKHVLNYPRYAGQWVYGSLTVPFRIRPAIGDHASSLFNGDFNVGFFFGRRAAFGNKFGVSLIGSFGVSSLSQTSSNNTGIKDTTSQSMVAITYGAGLVFDWAKNLQFGFIIGGDNGFDKLSATYIYQNKPWFALSLNYKFLSYKTADAAQQ